MASAGPSSSKHLVLLLGVVLTLCNIHLSLRCQERGIGDWSHSPAKSTDEFTDAPIPMQREIAVARAHLIDRSTLPYRCGMIFFYHVPSTGGSTINNWLLQYTPKNGGEVSYFTHWGPVRPDGSGDLSTERGFIEGGKRTGNRKKHIGMIDFVRNMTSDEWRSVHCHHSSLHLNASEHLLALWRSEVESQGCAFVASVMFRDPLSHALSLYKHIRRFNATREGWTAHLRSVSGRGYWQTQLDYFLYNVLARNPEGVDGDTKVRRALQLLRDHFDIISVGDHLAYMRALLEVTGWEEIEMRRKNTYRKEILLTKMEVEEMQRLLEENGDIDFMYQVKTMYGKK